MEEYHHQKQQVTGGRISLNSSIFQGAYVSALVFNVLGEFQVDNGFDGVVKGH